jgi:hypothetical protein
MPNHLVLTPPFHKVTEKTYGPSFFFHFRVRGGYFDAYHKHLIFAPVQKIHDEFIELETQIACTAKHEIPNDKKQEIIEGIKGIQFNLLYCLLFRREFSEFKTFVAQHNINLTAYNKHSIGVTPTFGKVKFMPLLELATVILQMAHIERVLNEQEVISFITYLIAHGLKFDSNKDNIKCASEFSDAYKLLLELDHALQKTLDKYPKEKWEKPFSKVLEKGGSLLQEPLNVYLMQRNSEANAEWMHAIQALGAQSFSSKLTM